MTQPLFRWLTRCHWLMLALLLAWLPQAHAEDAEVVMLIGRADYQATPQAVSYTHLTLPTNREV